MKAVQPERVKLYKKKMYMMIKNFKIRESRKRAILG